MNGITTHVLDISRGRPAVGIEVSLQIRSGHDWKEIGKGLTDANGRCSTLMTENEQVEPGTYRLLFNVGINYQMQRTEAFFGEIPVVFEVLRAEPHIHIPLLISPFGYSTYRGS